MPSSIYDSLRLAAAYAHARPPVHPLMIQAMRDLLGVKGPFQRVLDVGCGAGLSTAALEPFAACVIGLEPVETMLKYRAVVSSRSLFLVGRAEQLPFGSGVFDLITAAGSLNYVDLDLFLPEAARVLARTGSMVIYDFSEGRRLRGGEGLKTWFEEFQRRYPPPPDYALEVRSLEYERAGLRLEGYRQIEVPISMSLGSYLPYVLSETSVEAAIGCGVQESEIRDWCASTLQPVFDDTSLEVLFDGYLAWVRHG